MVGATETYTPNKTTGFRGVYVDGTRSSANPYYADSTEIRRVSQKIRDGGYATPEDAARAWDALARSEGGVDEHKLNFPHGRPRSELSNDGSESSGDAAPEEDEGAATPRALTTYTRRAREDDSTPAPLPARAKRARSKTPPPPVVTFTDQLHAAGPGLSEDALQQLISDKGDRDAHRIAEREAAEDQIAEAQARIEVLDREEAEEQAEMPRLQALLAAKMRASLRAQIAQRQEEQAALEAQLAAIGGAPDVGDASTGGPAYTDLL